mgnify:CR=1 FL=1
MNNHDAISLAKLAHSCQHMGAISLAKLCLTLEQHGHENNLAESNERLAPLTCEEERVATAFYDEVTKISSAHLSFNIATAYHRNINDASFSRLQSTLFVPHYLFPPDKKAAKGLITFAGGTPVVIQPGHDGFRGRRDKLFERKNGSGPVCFDKRGQL